MIIFQTPISTPEHNSLANKIGTYLERKISKKYAIIYDTYCYISHEILEKLGHFKNGDPHEYMQTRLIELDASTTFIAETIAWLVKQGTMPSSYAPDIAVIYDEDYKNKFRTPILSCEIVSRDTLDYDLFFKAYLYERLGIKEYFVFATDDRAGKLIKHYLLAADDVLPQYQAIPFALKDKAVYAEALAIKLPVMWKF